MKESIECATNQIMKLLDCQEGKELLRNECFPGRYKLYISDCIRSAVKEELASIAGNLKDDIEVIADNPKAVRTYLKNLSRQL